MTDIEAFLDRFFAAPNLVWPERSAEHRSAQSLSQYLLALQTPGECPVVLPRRQEGWDAAQAYVICWDVAHAGRIRPLLESAVAGTWTYFDGRVSHLDPADPIESAILTLVGPATTFTLKPSRETSPALFRALDRLVRSLQSAPPREQALPRPIGRVLRDFHIALASGLAETSMQLLTEMERSGGISLENLAFLQILRLSRLGQDAAVLAHPLFPVIVRAEPPRLVREALLGSWMRAHGPQHLTNAADVAGATSGLLRDSPDVAFVADASIQYATDEDALRLCGLISLARGDRDLAVAVSQSDLLREQGDESLIIPVALLERIREQAGIQDHPVPEGPDAGDESQSGTGTSQMSRPDSWSEWLVALDGGEGLPPLTEVCDTWPPMASADAELADIIDGTPLELNDALLSMTPFVLDSDNAGQPPWRCCASLVRRYLLGDRLAPSDLGAISALLRMFLSASPPATEYRELLGDLSDFAPRWLSVTNADVAIDMADVVVTSPRPDPSAALAFATSLLSPLLPQRNRLTSLAATAAWMVSRDLGLGWEWSDQAQSEKVDAVDGRQVTVLLYSLEDSVLTRVSEALERTYGRVTIHSSSAKRGSPPLRQQARNADLVVIATRRATHAATGFIAENASGAVVVYPDGSGSASMLRAVDVGLGRIATNEAP